MTPRPKNVEDFLKWFMDRLCKHPHAALVLANDTVVCKHCMRQFPISEHQYIAYATQFVTWEEQE